ncbi:MAG: class I SAM-dependent methyltransferase [Polyangiaceae bacterium]|nr:class I SAM-dependent methyltransferase [Polyangiaceae bacterium]
MWGRDGPSLLELARQALSGTARGYDLLAPKFDLTPFRTPTEVVDGALSELGPVRRALDLCCGTGSALEALHRITSEQVVGVDFSNGMLAVAREKASRLSGPPQIQLERADVLSLGYAESFDLVTCFGALGHIVGEDEPRFLRVVHRALTPGGRFVVVTAFPPKPLSLPWLACHAFNGVMVARNALIRPPFVMCYLTFLLPDLERHLRWYGFDVTLDRARFPAPYEALVRVIATKR